MRSNDFDEDFSQQEVSEFITNLPALTEEQRQKNIAENTRFREENPEDWDLHGIFGNEMKRIHGLPDWHFREIPWITLELFHELVNTIGSENLKIMSGSQMHKTQGGVAVTTCRASVLISPEGMERLASSTREEG